MTITLKALCSHLDELLDPGRFKDYCPNGLQVEGSDTVTRLVTGVTASQALLDSAVAWEADAVLVHHGYFWRGENQRVVGMKRRRLATLLANDMSLLAYHLPLDAHPKLGNNARLGQLMGIDTWRPLGDGVDVGSVGELPEVVPAKVLVERLATLTARQPLHVGDGDQFVQTVAWCTGAAQSYIEAAVAAGADVFITGEASEPTVHTAREEGIQFIAAGHHATERYGVQALGEHLQKNLGIEHRFIDIDNPV